MKKVSFNEYQEILMNSFKKINDFFTSQNIKWWAHSGTLLGAARNSGLIEWDDDIDMTMSIHEWTKNKSKILNFLESIGWEGFCSIDTRGLDATRFFFKEKIMVEYKGKNYITKPFIDVMLSIPKDKISKSERKRWSIFNQYNFIFSNRYRLVPYYGWKNKNIIKIGWFTNFLVFTQKILFYPITFWVPIRKKIFLKKNIYFSNKVAMYYNYDNNGIIYDLDKINTKHKFGDTEIYSSDDWKNELNIWFGGEDNWKSLPPEDDRIPHHLLLTPADGRCDSKYKISPYIII